MNLTDELRAAAADPPPTRIDLDRLIAREDRRQVRVRWLAAACAAAVAVTATVVGVRLAAVPAVEHRVGYVFSPDRVPDFTSLPRAERLWPHAVHRLPATLPDGADYAVSAKLPAGRYLVTAGLTQPANAPSIFDTRARTVAPVVPVGAIGGVDQGRVLTAKVVGDQVVWMLEGFRSERPFRELWAVRLDGTGLRRLTPELPEGTLGRFAVTGDTVWWDVEKPNNRKPPFNTVWRVPLAGGKAAEQSGGRGWSLVYDGPWLTTQGLPGLATYREGELWNPATGEKRRWVAHRDVPHASCGPAWCSGETASQGRVALHKLDGTGYVELPYAGRVQSAREGRLAIVTLMSTDIAGEVVWDRQTGRAAVLGGTYKPAKGKPAQHGGSFNSDFDPPVKTWRTADHLMLLDLGAID